MLRWFPILSCLSLLAASAAQAEEHAPEGKNSPPLAASPAAAAADAAGGELQTLVTNLDAPLFDRRQRAARELVAAGAPAVPYLIAALGDDSCEIRVRARLLLSRYNAFEEVAPHLVAAVDKAYGPRVRELLVERAMLQIDLACASPHADQLFKFWGTSRDVFHDRVRVQLAEAKTQADNTQAVAPLLGLSAKASRFGGFLSRLEALSISCEGSYDPGAAMAQTLARGFSEERPDLVAFAEQHVQALERLVTELKRQRKPPHSIRQELMDRMNMCQGAAHFLVDILDAKSPQREILTRRIGLTSRSLIDEFFRGLAATDVPTYDRGVGRVHIVDMLTESLRKWPAAPESGVVQRLVSATARTADTADKPKALAYLDALEACRELATHKLDVNAGLGSQLAERLYQAALEAANIRAYSPTRRLHDKLMALVDKGIGPEHAAFPRQLLERHLRGTAEATTDEQLLATERYLRSLDRLRTAGVDLAGPGSKRYVAVMRDRLLSNHEAIAAGVSQLEQLLGTAEGPTRQLDLPSIDRALGTWAEQMKKGAGSASDR